MENGLCFGRWYGGEAQECRLCEVREECMIAMQDERKMPCFMQYDPANYACTIACHLGGTHVNPGEPGESVCEIATRGADAEVPLDDLTEAETMVEKVQEPIEDVAKDQVAEEQVAEEQVAEEQVAEEQVAEEVAVPARTVAEPEGEPPLAPVTQMEKTGAVASPEGVPDEQAKPGKKMSKKAVIREAILASPEGISADEIVTRIMDAGLATEEEMDKTRHYVVMSISHLRKAGKEIELREGKYVLTGDQSE